MHMLLHKSLAGLAVVALLSVNAYAGKLDIPAETMRDLSDQRLLLGDIVKKLDETNRRIATAKSDMHSADDSIQFAESESKKAKANLEKKQAYDRDNPGEIVEQLRAAEEKNQTASRAVEDAKEKRAKYEADLIALNKVAAEQHNEFLKQQKSFEREIDRVVDIGLQERLRVLQVSKIVEVTERVPCGDDPIPVCKERSKKAAELKASEQGSVVGVNSMTEVKNFKLTKEELRSEVSATLSNKVFSNQHLIGETEYETTVKANVEPVIGDSLREQMASNIRSDIYNQVGGRIDYSQVQDPEDAGDDAPPVKRVASKKKAVKKPVVVEEAPVEEAPVEEASVVAAPRPSRKVEKPMISF